MKKLIKKITHWEAWPFKILYAPIAPFWFYYMLKSRSVWFFTPSNPKITFGGLDGEPKKEMYELLPKSYYPKTINIFPEEDFSQVVKKIEASGFDYPFIVKPDIGCQGILFRKIDQESQLNNYHQNAPVEYLVQEFVTFSMEVSVFYIRHPKDQKGKVTGFLHKIPMQVMGDGVSTLQQLIHHHPKAKKNRIQEFYEKHKSQWNQVIEKGEKYLLSYAANHNRGAHFVDLKEQIDDELVSIFDEISNGIDDFYYGRYDIICNSIEDLKQKKNFLILEYNGCGAEPNHFYDTGYTLLGAYREILMHWKYLYQISVHNKKMGIKPWPFMKGYKFINNTNALFKKMREADAKII